MCASVCVCVCSDESHGSERDIDNFIKLLSRTGNTYVVVDWLSALCLCPGVIAAEIWDKWREREISERCVGVGEKLWGGGESTEQVD